MMMICRLAVLLLAAQSISTSAAVVHRSNLRAESGAQKAKTLTFSERIWNNTVTQFVEHELTMPKAAPGSAPKVDKLCYVLFTMLFGFCGCDRCFMGQILAGTVKGFTFGGFFIWYLVDYFVCLYIALSKSKDIHMVGYNHEFEESTIQSAFIACIVLLIVNCFSQRNSTSNYQIQMAEQQTLQAHLESQYIAAATNTGATIAATPPRMVPLHHQLSGHLPTPLTKALRKAKILGKDPTIPELIGAFQTMDKDGDGKLDRDELKQSLSRLGVSDEDVDAMIKEADTAGDGKISKLEFLAYHAKKAAEKAAKKGAEA